MIKENEVYKIGKIGKPHGVKGEVTLRFSDDVFDRVDADYLILDTDGILVPFFMEDYRFRSDEVALVKFCDIDNMERASVYANGEELAKGVAMIVSSIPDALKKMGVCEIETKKFDPRIHNAVMHVEDENLGEGEIVEVFQKGYMLGDKVIRHAMVKVAN